MVLRRRRPPPGLPSHWTGWNRVPPDRLRLAEQIEASDDFGVDVERRGLHGIALFDDVRALVGDEAIEALADKIAALDGVDGVEGVDREVIEVEGPITADQLAAYVIAELAATGDPHCWDHDSS